jgi:hypothetical protein
LGNWLPVCGQLNGQRSWPVFPQHCRYFVSTVLAQGDGTAVLCAFSTGPCLIGRADRSTVDLSAVSLEVVAACDHGRLDDGVINGQFFQHLIALNHVAKGGVAAVHQVQAGWRQLRFVEEEEELG